MSFDFFKKVIGGTSDTTFDFGRKFMLNGTDGAEPTYIDVILSGVSPLTLTKAKANGLNYVKAFGKTEQTNLPSGYTQLKYVQNTATTTRINTGIMPQVGDEIEIRFITPYSASTSNYLLQAREGANAGIFGISGSQTGKTIILSWGTGNSITSSITRELNHVYVVKASVIDTTLTLYVKDVTAGTEDTVTDTITTPSDAETPYFIWGNTSQYLAQITPVYYAKITNNGTVKLNYVAAKDSNNSASFYDLVNNTFITNFDGTITGSEDLATPTPDTPINIVSNNGVIKVRQNLIDLNAVTDGYYYDSQGVYSALSNTRVTDYISVEAGQSITIYFKSLSTASNLNVRINIFNSNKVWQSQEVLQLLPNTGDTKIITPTANGYIRVSGNYSGNAIVDWNTAKTVYGEYTVDTIDNAIGQIYTEGTQEVVTDSKNNSATAEMLLNVGTYKDVQSLLDGVVTRNTVIKILDGSESWQTAGQTGGRYRYRTALSGSPFGQDVLFSNYFEGGKSITDINSDTTITEACTLYQRYLYIYTKTFATVEELTTWLSNQYASGKPVMIVYPLATPTTESVTGQTLSTKSGTNTITATGSLDNLELEVSFKQQQS